MYTNAPMRGGSRSKARSGAVVLRGSDAGKRLRRSHLRMTVMGWWSLIQTCPTGRAAQAPQAAIPLKRNVKRAARAGCRRAAEWSGIPGAHALGEGAPQGAEEP